MSTTKLTPEASKRGGRFLPGQSGNPAGRPPNTASLTHRRAQLAEHLPGAIEQIAAKAQAGDLTACRVIVERCLPPLKAVEVAAAVDLTGCITHAEKVLAVMDASARGDITAAQLVDLLGALERAEAALKAARKPKSFLGGI